jgi:hypothetical protein
LGDLVAEFGDPGACCFVGHGAFLDCDVVAVDRGVGLPDLRGDDVEFGAAVGVRGPAVVLGGSDCWGEEGVGVGVEVG